MQGMAGILHFARNDPEIAERRTQTRTLVTPPIYANIENLNGGLVYNMSEDGLALSAALNLGGDGTLGMQIHLPDSGGWIEATGEIAWRSGSGKTVGIKFLSLSEEARLRIRNWLASENLQREPPSEGEKLTRLEPLPAIGAAARTTLFPLPDPVDSGMVAELHTPAQTNSTDSSVLNDEPPRVVAQPTLQPAQIASGSLVARDGSAQPGERRAFPRSPIRPFSYVELGRDNGGVLLNISESGLAVTSAMPLAENHLSTIVVQFTGSRDQVNVSGQIAWISESKKEAGIRFLNVTEEARSIIASRISREESPAEEQPQNVKVADAATSAAIPKIRSLKIPKRVDFPVPVASPPAIPEIPKVKILKSLDTPSDAPVQERLWASVPSSLTTSDLGSDMVPAETVVASSELSNKRELRRKSRPAFHPRTSKAVSDQLRRLAALLILAAVAGLAIRWVAASPGIRREVVGFIAENTKGLNKAVEPKVDLPANKATDAPVLQSQGSGSPAIQLGLAPIKRDVKGSESGPTHVPSQVRSGERSVARLAVNNTVRRAESPLVKSQLAKPPQHTVVAVPNPAPVNARSQSVVSTPAQPAQNIATPTPSLPSSIPSGTSLAEVKEKEPPPPPKQPLAPVTPTWSVSVSTDPYPSLRIPPDVSSQKAMRGSSLQIGRATTRVEPVYPEEAMRQGVEGTVKLHVVVGRDGTVQSAEPIGGPTLLAKAAMSAIREWHYGQTLLAGQPVETEQDIVVNFRLVNPSVSKN